MDADRILVKEALVEECELERQLRLAPQRALGLEADVAVAVVVEALQLLREPRRPLVRRRRQLARPLGHVVEVERPCRARRAQHEQDSEQHSQCSSQGAALRKTHAYPADVAGQQPGVARLALFQALLTPAGRRGAQDDSF
jgi:hypothetical protein